ncbi:hypothetical protein PLESTM_001333500 [Pleodorina starrii]|nr:hypothetical protein PLESTM_001333500 [Pleodorina starrii]
MPMPPPRPMLPAPPSLPVPVFVTSCNTTCIDFRYNPVLTGTIPYNFTQEQCASYAANVDADLAAAATAAGAVIAQPFSLTTCDKGLVRVCGAFANDTERQKLWPLDDLLTRWLTTLLIDPGRGGGGEGEGASCPTYFYNRTLTVSAVGYNGGIPVQPGESTPALCRYDEAKFDCAFPNITFPTCRCDTQVGSAPFAAQPFYTTKPGRRASTTLYCFTFSTFTADSNATCGNATVFQKVEFWANDALRRNVRGFGLRPEGAANMSFVFVSWGGQGDATLKATALAWSLEQASGAEICLELDSVVSLGDLCLGDYPNACVLSIYDASRKCCPAYAAMDKPYVPALPGGRTSHVMACNKRDRKLDEACVR